MKGFLREDSRSECGEDRSSSIFAYGDTIWVQRCDGEEGDTGGAEKGQREEKVESDVGVRANAPTVDAQSDDFGNVSYHSGYYLVDVSHEQMSYLVVLFFAYGCQ